MKTKLFASAFIVFLISFLLIGCTETQIKTTTDTPLSGTQIEEPQVDDSEFVSQVDTIITEEDDEVVIGEMI